MTKTIRKMLQRALATRQVLWVSAIPLHQNFSIGTFRSKRLKYMNIWQNGHNITLTLTRGLNYQFEKPFEENDFVEENLLQANTELVAGKSKAAMSGAVLHSHCHLYIHFEYNYAVLLKTVYWKMFRRWNTHTGRRTNEGLITRNILSPCKWLRYRFKFDKASSVV